MPSFDVVSRLDHQEIDNAIGNATREITTRYDFKGSDTSIEKKENSIIVTTDDEMKAGQVNDMLVTHFVRRKVDPLCLKKKELEKAGGNKIRQTYDLIEGIEQTLCKKIKKINEENSLIKTCILFCNSNPIPAISFSTIHSFICFINKILKIIGMQWKS